MFVLLETEGSLYTNTDPSVSHQQQANFILPYLIREDEIQEHRPTRNLENTILDGVLEDLILNLRQLEE